MEEKTVQQSKKKLFKTLRTSLKTGYEKGPRIRTAETLSSGLIAVEKVAIFCEEKTTKNTQHLFKLTEGGLEDVTGPIPLGNEVVVEAYNNSKTRKIVFKLDKETSKKPDIFNYNIQIFNAKSNIIEFSFKTSEIEKNENFINHGQIEKNPWIVRNTVIWSDNDTKVLYCVKKNSIKKKGIFEDKGKILKKSVENTENFNYEEELLRDYDFNKNWGFDSPLFFKVDVMIIDLENGTLGRIDGFDDNMVLIYPHFLGEKNLIFAGIPRLNDNSRLLGRHNRESSIYFIENFGITPLLKKSKFSKENKKIEKPLINIIQKISQDPISHHPIALNSKENLIIYAYSSIWLESGLFSFGLKLYNTITKETEILVEDRDIPILCDEKKNEIYDIENYKETALFIMYLSSKNSFFDAESGNFLLATTEKSNTILNQINIYTKERKIRVIKFDFETEKIRIMSYEKNPKNGKISILFVKENFSNYSILGYIDNSDRLFSGEELSDVVIWEKREEAQEGEEYLVKSSLIKEEVLKINGIPCYLWKSKHIKDPKKTLLNLHAGPHMAFELNYDPAYNILINNGVQILGINYPGSSSFTSNYNEIVNGKLLYFKDKGDKSSDLSVIDELIKVIDILEEQKKINKDNLYFEGFCFGGYLALKMLEKDNKIFKKVILINPSISLIHFSFSSAIPELTFNEILGLNGKFMIERDYSDEEILRIIKHSPFEILKGLEGLETKISVFLAKEDTIVPFQGTVFFFKRMREIGVNVQLRLFEKERHFLMGIESCFECEFEKLVMMLFD